VRSAGKGSRTFSRGHPCKDTETDHWVLIENQLERTDHTHLGQLLTYAAGLDAVTIVWITERFTEEHRAALDWLNQKTEESINFFGLEVELWRIGESLIAPKFSIISKPNDWTRAVRGRASGELTEHKGIQFKFWTAYKDFVESKSGIECGTPHPRHWMTHSIGIGGVHLSSVASMWNSATDSYSIPELRVELVLSGLNPKLQMLESNKEEMEKNIGQPLTWANVGKPGKCRIYARRDADIRNASLWPEQHKWLFETLETFNRVFKPLMMESGSKGDDPA
jgi:hypothetical protein